MKRDKHGREMVAEVGNMYGQPTAVPARPELPSLIDDAARRKGDSSNDMFLDRRIRYRRNVDGILYIAMTDRPEISYAVGILTRCLAFPTDELLKEAEHVLISLYNARTLATTYKNSMESAPVRSNWAPTLGPVTNAW
eukprot:6212153-Pleurochrysis_carterae.AAC.6